MKDQKEIKWKSLIDNLLIYNLYILIIGSIFLALSFILTFNGNFNLYSIFQKLWYPIFIPSLSLFFTAILIEAIINKFFSKEKNNFNVKD